MPPVKKSGCLGADRYWLRSRKRLLGIKVVRLSGQPIELWRLILLRNIAIHAIAQLCGLVGIVDAVMIFSASFLNVNLTGIAPAAGAGCAGPVVTWEDTATISSFATSVP